MEPIAIIQSKKANTAQSKVKGQEPCFSEIKKEANSTFERSFDARNKTVNIEPLKSFVFQNFPKGCPLRDVLAAERTILTIPEFLAKLETWQHLLRAV